VSRIILAVVAVNSCAMQPSSLLPRLSSLRNALQSTLQHEGLSLGARLPQACRMTTQNGAHGKLDRQRLQYC
jgi:hypothetical protein